MRPPSFPLSASANPLWIWAPAPPRQFRIGDGLRRLVASLPEAPFARVWRLSAQNCEQKTVQYLPKWRVSCVLRIGRYSLPDLKLTLWSTHIQNILSHLSGTPPRGVRSQINPRLSGWTEAFETALPDTFENLLYQKINASKLFEHFWRFEANQLPQKLSEK